MKLQRVFAPDIRQAIRLVREKHGPDAVIVSNRQVPGGVELVSAIDYDPAGLDQGQRPEAVPVTPHAPRAKSRGIETRDEESNSSPGLAPEQQEESSARDRLVAAREPRLSSDPILADMRQELSSLRSMVESQLSNWTWDHMKRRQPYRAELLRRLAVLGFDGELSTSFADEVVEEKNLEHAWELVQASLCRRIPVTGNDILDRGGVITLVGPTGVGKTTSIAKLAARFCLRHGSRHLALVTTDTYRIGAHEQLYNYGRILDVPVRVATSGEELASTLDSFADKRLVLVDTAGMSQRDLRLGDQFSLLRSAGATVNKFLVLSAPTQADALEETARTFGRLELDGCLVTKTDEATSLGGVLGCLIRHRLPVAFIGDGQRVPEDIHQARAYSLAERCIALAQESSRGIDDQFLVHTFGGAAAHAHV